MSLKSNVYRAIKKCFIAVTKCFPNFVGERLRAELSQEMIPIKIIKTKFGDLKYFCFGGLNLWRAATLHEKEPEMIAWLDRMEEKSVFWDIGANIGLYSIYAGKRDMKVYAFEPSALNTCLISKNIELNGMKNNVIMYPIAISDYHEFGYLNMSTTNWGGGYLMNLIKVS